MGYKNSTPFTRMELVPIALIIAMFAIGAFSFGRVPDRIPTHWNAKGEIDGYSGKVAGLFLLPAITLALYLMLTFIPYAAAYNDKVRSFHFLMSIVKMIFSVFMFALYAATLFVAYGYAVDMNLVLAPLFCFMLYGMGHVMGMAKRNNFIGIRTPWTLGSDEVWDKTHKRAATVFKAMAAIIAILVVFRTDFIWPMIILVLTGSGYLVAYSYIVHKRLKRTI